MKILFIISTPFPPKEGIGYCVYHLSKKLILAGNNVTVLTRGGLFKEEFDFEGIKVIKVTYPPIYPFHILLHKFFLKKLIYSKNDYELIHYHTPLTPYVPNTIPTICTVHTSLVEDAKYLELIDMKSIGHKIFTRIISYPLVKELIENSGKVTTVANSVSHELDEYYHFPNSIVLKTGVDQNLFFPLKMKNCDKYLLFVGRLSYRKGIFDLIKSYQLVKKNYDIKLILVGTGEMERIIKKLTKKEHLENNIQILGYVEREELIKIYQKAKIFIMPSHYEGLPAVLLEAMACSLPVVATAVSGNLDVIHDNENGFLVSPKDPKGMADKIMNLLENQELCNKLGENARKTILDHYTWDKISNKYIKCYKSLIKENS